MLRGKSIERKAGAVGRVPRHGWAVRCNLLTQGLLCSLSASKGGWASLAAPPQDLPLHPPRGGPGASSCCFCRGMGQRHFPGWHQRSDPGSPHSSHRVEGRECCNGEGSVVPFAGNASLQVQWASLMCFRQVGDFFFFFTPFVSLL